MDDLNPRPSQEVGEPVAAAPAERRKRGSVVTRAAVATVVAGGLAAGSYGVASAASSAGAAPAQPGAPALTAGSAPVAPSTPSEPPFGQPPFGGPGPLGYFGPALGPLGGPGPFGFFGSGLGPFSGPGRLGYLGPGDLLGPGGTISAVTATTITVKSLFGSAVTITTNASTVYSEGGRKVARTALTVGEHVAFRPAVSPGASSSGSGSGSSHLVTGVEILQAHVYGKVAAVSGSQIVVSEAGGSTAGLNLTVNTSQSATTYDEAGHAVSASELKVGTVVLVTGTLSANHDDVDATTIEIVPASVAGRVTRLSGTTIRIQIYSGTVETLTTNSGTLFRTGTGKATLASVAKGDLVEAFGTQEAGRTFAALTVFVGPSAPTPAGRPRGFGGGFIPRFGGRLGAGFGSGFGGGFPAPPYPPAISKLGTTVTSVRSELAM